jgi:flagellar basal-body rod protein FlgB
MIRNERKNTMGKDMFATQGTSGLKRVLDATETRQKFITHNIANANTPNYIAQDLNFTDLVKASQNRDNLAMFGLSYTNPKHFSTSSPTDNSPFHLDGQFMRNFVRYKNSSEEEEMVNLAENAVAYKAAADILAREYRLMNIAVTGGK